MIGKYSAALLLGIAAVALVGCAGGPQRQPPIFVFPDMRNQGKYKPQTDRPFFSDHRASRMPVAGTVPLGQLKEDEPYFTGVANNQYVGRNPEKITAELLTNGQHKFNTYCSPCHDQTGHGRGLVGKNAIWIASNLHEDRIVQYNDGEIYNVISHGRRSMPGYKNQIVEADRWAIVAYVRALQRATLGTVDEVPADQRSLLK